ncbi:MAG TPA: lipopolysaccharide biosynthesis protein RfbH [Bryobacteraceae bacterium]|nr:lipopolysaccharide biosynthesis protein RfbH [Bryobacteraceae bacterium]
MSARSEQLRQQILDLVAAYHDEAFGEREFVPGESPVPVSGRVFESADVQALVDSGLDFWLTAGRFAAQFEKKFARFFGVRGASLVNSGSSANLLALTALTSPRLEDRRLKPGDEVITVAAGFPTTVNPIIQNGLIPVFVDVQVPTYNIDVTRLEAALSDRTRAVVIAHTLGNPFDLAAVSAFVKRHNLWLIEDCCDAVGSTYQGRHVGTFGDLATVSFYPAHHITMGEGGCVLAEKPLLTTVVESFRDWGRDCWCDPGRQNTCGKRFEWQLGELPCGYDHKYTYSHIGYNLKVTDMQAAVGLAQLEKLPQFIARRKANFRALREGLASLEEFFILPEATAGSDPSWFGFPLSVRPGAPWTRNQVIQYLEERKIATRLLFAGNLTRQPAYKDVRMRVAGSLKNTDFVMDHAFWIGVYPGITTSMRDYVLETFHSLVRTLQTAP